MGRRRRAGAGRDRDSAPQIRVQGANTLSDDALSNIAIPSFVLVVLFSMLSTDFWGGTSATLIATATGRTRDVSDAEAREFCSSNERHLSRHRVEERRACVFAGKKSARRPDGREQNGRHAPNGRRTSRSLTCETFVRSCRPSKRRCSRLRQRKELFERSVATVDCLQSHRGYFCHGHLYTAAILTSDA